ncbi:TPR-12 multi-domain protein [Pyrenophora tritici-repentis]|nr:TPR-12 multi-domain protein [Pyrenophora tritici-repentis]
MIQPPHCNLSIILDLLRYHSKVDQICAAPDARAALVWPRRRRRSKSQLAIEHAYRTHEQSPETWVFWVHASNAVRFEQSYRDIADRVKIFGRRDPQANIFKLVHDWLCDSRQRWLLVLDNLDDARFLISDQADGHHQAQTTNARRDIVSVKPMDKAEGIALFTKKLGPQGDNSDVTELAAALEYMPLAIVQAAAYILQRAPRCSVGKYLDEYRQSERKQTSLLDHNEGQFRRDREARNSILVTWQISFEYIQQTRSSAADLLSLMSFFDRQGIPEDLLRPRTERQGARTIQTEKVRNPGDSDSDDDISQPSAGENEFEDDIFEANSKLEQWKEQFVSNLCAAFPTGEYENWVTCRALFAHARSAIGQLPEHESSLAEWATLLYRAAWYAERMGNSTDAATLATESMRARKKVLGQEHQDTLSSMAMVGSAYRLGGRWADAEKLEVQVMETRKKKLGADHPDTLISMANLAFTWKAQGRSAEAVVLMRQCVQQRQRVLKASHPDLKSSLAALEEWETK